MAGQSSGQSRLVTIKVFGTEGCHLCHEADVLIERVLKFAEPMPQVEWIDISQEPSLLECYGTRIPVVKTERLELDWPFDEDALKAILLCDP